MFKGYVYRHWIIDDKGEEKSYIGQVYNLKGKANPQRRWKKDGKGYAPKKGKEPTHFYNAICKYGWDNFNHKVLFAVECETPEELVFWLDEWEKYYIWLYDSFYNGYNSTTGGNSGRIYDEEAKQKMSEAKKGKSRKPFSEEHKQKIGEARKGKTHSEEAKRKMSEAKKGKPQKPRSEETKRKMSEAKKGKPSSRKGKPGKQHSEETKQKMSESRSKKVICLETLQVFQSARAADEWNGLKSGVNKCCRGERKTVGKHPITGAKLHWMYLDEYEMLTKEKELKK